MNHSDYSAASDETKLKYKIMFNLRFGPLPIDLLMAKSNIDIDKKTLYQKLDALKSHGFVSSQIYGDISGHKYALYALTEQGAAEIIEILNIEIELVRTNFPSAHTVAHELVVVDVVRTIVRESDNCRYVVRYFDENYLRKEIKLLNLKRHHIPDLHTIIEFRRQPGVIRKYNIEVDMGTVPKLDVVQKLLSYQSSTFMLCSTNMRIDALRMALVQYEKLYTKVVFATIWEFCSRTGGFVGTEWITIDGRKAVIYSTKGK